MNFINYHNYKTSSLRHNISIFLITASIVFTCNYPSHKIDTLKSTFFCSAGLLTWQCLRTIVLQHVYNLSVLSTFSDTIVGLAANRCNLYREYTENDLSITDIVLESAKKDTTCLKAKFRLRIKVEGQSQSQSNQSDVPIMDSGDFLGYIPLDSVIDVENTCPDNIATLEPRQTDKESTDSKQTPIDELRMAVQFLCGSLTFTFRKTSNLTLLTLEGFVNLGKVHHWFNLLQLVFESCN